MSECKNCGSIHGENENTLCVWFESIPEKGILCKEKGRNTYHLITEIDKDYNMDECERTADGIDVDDLTPLTAEDIWQFMPWQPMDTAPYFDKFIARVRWITAEDGSVSYTYEMAYRSKVVDNLFMVDAGIMYSPFEWLPLPRS